MLTDSISHVFGQPVAQRTASAEDEESDFALVQSQRAAKRARVATTAGDASAAPTPPNPGVPFIAGSPPLAPTLLPGIGSLTAGLSTATVDSRLVIN